MKQLILLIFFSALCYSATAQPGNPLNPSPIDGGLSLLLAGGVALGYKAYKGVNKKGDL